MTERGEYKAGELLAFSNVEETVAARMESVRRRESIHFEYELWDGRTIEIRRSIIESGGFVSTYTDVTERKQMEQAIRESERLVVEILENLPMGTGISRRSSGTVAFTNTRFRELFRIGDDDVIGRTCQYSNV